MMKNHPSIVDKYYHRGILTSNAAETTFSVIKRRISLQKQSLLTVLQYFISYSMSWLIKSTKIEIPFFLKGRVNPLIRKNALEYIKKNMMNIQKS